MTAGTVVDLVAPIAAARAAGIGLGVRGMPVDASEPGWRAAGAVAADAVLRAELLARTAAAAGIAVPAVDATSSPAAARTPSLAAAGTPSLAIAATWHLEKHAWLAAGAALAGVLLHGRLPPLERAWIRCGEYGWPEEIALPGEGWSRGDGADVARALEDHLAPLVDALVVHRARRPLWRSAGDRLGQAARWCAEAFAAPDGARALAEAAFAAPTALRAPAGFVLRDGLPDRRRTGCCLSHRCPGGPRCDDCAALPATSGAA